MMELEQLRQLVAFAEQGTLSRAAEELHISERTTYRHLTSIYEKTGASSRLGLSLIYYGKYKNEGVGRQTGEKRPPE